jgi:hypothetical protein
MSLPSSGKLQARILGDSVEFDGKTWTGDDPFTVELLNAQTPSHTGHHITIEIAGPRILADVASEWEILSVEHDAWDESLPADYED